MLVINGLDDLSARSGQQLGTSDWVQITQDDIDAFAAVTGDVQWIHVDPERAKQGPFGDTIVHGYFTLALAPRLQADVFALHGITMGINYGLNRVRFPAAMPVGGRVRLSIELTSVDRVTGGVQASLTNTFECEGLGRPVCVAEFLLRAYGA